MEEREKATLSVEIDKELLLRFKSMCVLRERTMSEEIEHMLRDWVELNHDQKTVVSPKPQQKNPEPEGDDLSDKIEEEAEKA